RELTFAHVMNGAVGGANYATILGVTNTSATSQAVTMSFNSDSGTVVSVTRTIAAGGSLRETASDLFGLAADFQTGWMNVNGTDSITGFAAYADTAGGGLAVIPPGNAESKIFFSYIANGAPQWQTGIALLNASSNATNVEIYAMDPLGNLIAGAENVTTA